ncbi:MAG: hypothetical protein Q9162_006828 [Coniocarpon cinnabarinum]
MIRALDAIFRLARWRGATQLEQTLAAGALCVVVKIKPRRKPIANRRKSRHESRGLAHVRLLGRTWPSKLVLKIADVSDMISGSKNLIWHVLDHDGERYEDIGAVWKYSGPSTIFTPAERNVLGACSLPDGYALACAPRHTKIAGGEFSVASSSGIVKALIALFQTLYAASTLYHVRADQLDRYGFAAYGLTVTHFAVMSLLNVGAHLATPDYPSMFMLRTDTMAEAERLGGRFSGEVGRVVADQGKQGKSAIASLDTPETVTSFDETSAHMTELQVAGKVFPASPPIIVSIASLSLIMVGYFSHYRHGSSTAEQRNWILAWTFLNKLVGPFIQSAKEFDLASSQLVLDPAYGCYPENIDHIRETEYPMLSNAIYLDHAGKPPPAKSFIQRITSDMMSNLYGNSHANSASSQLSMDTIESSRRATLQLFNASPADFDVVFVANATAAIKLVIDCFRSHHNGFWYGYHKDSHTSLVGGREEATLGHHCFATDESVEHWLSDAHGLCANLPIHPDLISKSSAHMSSLVTGADSTSVNTSSRSADDNRIELFAWPAQSNMNGRRLPLSWAGMARACQSAHRYTLVDAAALVSTSTLDLSDPQTAPDFTAFSFYKMFGFPEIGALIVRKESAHVLQRRKYFGGGTVDMVSCLEDQWHVAKTSTVHSALEDGTIPIHNIAAIRTAIDVHRKLYGSFANTSRHTHRLMQRLVEALQSLQHANGRQMCVLYNSSDEESKQGPIVAFNVADSDGVLISCTEVERLAGLHNIHIRSGGLCNPGGVADSLGLSSQDLKRSLSAGYKCGTEHDIVNGKSMGMLRASFGAMSNDADVSAFIDFIKDNFRIQNHLPITADKSNCLSDSPELAQAQAQVKDLIVYPIKSCSGFSIPPHHSWPMQPHGLKWDRQWCIVDSATGNLLTQKRCPRMALIKPILDLENRVLLVELDDVSSSPRKLYKHGFKPYFTLCLQCVDCDIATKRANSDACNEHQCRSTDDKNITELLNQFLGRSCHLAHSSIPNGKQGDSSTRPKIDSCLEGRSSSRSLSNESPILAIMEQSVMELNDQIEKRRPGTAPVSANAFRPNIVFTAQANPFDEDDWSKLKCVRNRGPSFDVLGSCRRCQVACTDVSTGKRRPDAEPLATLLQNKRSHVSGAWFGVHLRAIGNHDGFIQIGDIYDVCERDSRASNT